MSGVVVDSVTSVPSAHDSSAELRQYDVDSHRTTLTSQQPHAQSAVATASVNGQSHTAHNALYDQEQTPQLSSQPSHRSSPVPPRHRSIPLTAIHPHQHTHTSPSLHPIHGNGLTTSPVLHGLSSKKQQSPMLCSISSPTQSHIHDDTCVLDQYQYSLDNYADTDDSDSIHSIDLSEHTVDADESDVDNETVGVVICGADKSITHINDAFTRITGYSTTDLLGRPSLSLLQGQETSVQAVTTIRTAISQNSSCKVCLINYRKDGQPFWNLLTILPMMNKTSSTVDAWIGIQRLHQPKPYVDRLLKMFPWTTHMPNNVGMAANGRRRKQALRHEQLMLTRHDSNAQRKSNGVGHRDNTPTLSVDVRESETRLLPVVDDAVQPVVDKSLARPGMYRFSQC